MNLLKNLQIDYAGAAVGLSSSIDDNTTIFDMQGFDGIMFLTTITDSVTSGIATLKVEENTANSDSGMAAITGASAAKTCASSDDINGKTLIVDVYRPLKRYVQGVRTSSAANIAFGEVQAIRYRGKSKPVTQGATCANSVSAIGS